MNRLSQLPAVDRVLARPEVAALAQIHGRAVVVDAVRRALDGARTAVGSSAPLPTEADIAFALRTRIRRR